MALSEIDQRPFCTASTSVTPSPVKSPKRSWLIGNDELLVVVSGTPTLRAPDGERELQPGDCILFPSGPDGAHKLTNRSDDVVRVLLVSNFALPRAAVQVDSGKMMLRWGSGRDERRWFFLGEDADYWDGEAAE